MSAASPEYVEYISELLEPLGEIKTGRMFSGIGFKQYDVQFAMVMDDTLYFVVDDQTRQKYIDHGQECFSYEKKTGRVDVRKYYTVPADLIEGEDEIIDWAQEAIEAAQRQYKGKK